MGPKIGKKRMVENYAYMRQNLDLIEQSINKRMTDKLGLSCAKLRPAWASYQLAFVWLVFIEAAY